MNQKMKVDKRYKPPNGDHVSKWEHLEEFPINVLRQGQVVKISRCPGVFEFQYAERNTETGAVNLTFVGGRPGQRLVRTFTPERVGEFLWRAHAPEPD